MNYLTFVYKVTDELLLKIITAVIAIIDIRTWLSGVVVTTLDFQSLVNSQTSHCLVISQVCDRISRVNYLVM